VRAKVPVYKRTAIDKGVDAVLTVAVLACMVWAAVGGVRCVGVLIAALWKGE